MQHPPKKAGKSRRKGLVHGVLLAALAAVLLFSALILPKLQQQKKKETAPTVAENPVRQLYTAGDARLQSVHIAPENGEEYDLVMDGGSLKLRRGDELLSIDEEEEEELVNMLTNLTSQKTIAEHTEEVEAALGDMGLAPALCSARLLWSDGEEQLLELGEQVPETGYSYMRISGIDGIYAADEGLKDALNRSAQRLLPITQPEISVLLLRSLDIQNSGGSMTIELTRDEEGITSGRLTFPQIYPIQDETVSSLLSSLSNFRLGSLAADINDTNCADYGFSAPECRVTIYMEEGWNTTTNEEGAISLTPAEAGEIRLVFGCEYRQHYYTCLWEGRYYLVSKYLIQPLLKLKPEDMASRCPMDMGEDALLEEITLQTPQGTYVLKASYTQDEDGEWAVADCFLNGEPIAEERFRSVVDALRAVTVSGDLKEGEVPSGEPVWALKLSTTGGILRSIGAYRRDSFTQTLAVDGIALHYCNMELQDTLTELFSEKDSQNLE